MLHRRITAGACALCLVVPAAAAASPAQDPAAAKPSPVTYGDTRHDLQNQPAQDPAAAKPSTVTYGDTRHDLHNQPDLNAPAGASSSATTSDTGARLDHRGLRSTVVVATPAKPAVASNGDTNGWQIAAIAEAGLLAAFAIGGAAVVSARQRRAAHVG